MHQERAGQFLADLSTMLQQGVATKDLLELAATQLAVLAKDSRQWKRSLPAAVRGEELCYELGADPRTGIALYLVSDGPGSISPPHEHRTWAVIAGASGVERNRLYRRVSSSRVAQTEVVSVGEGDTLVLPSDSIHSTEVVGSEPTYHMHLYGVPLAALPPIATRTFEIANDV